MKLISKEAAIAAVQFVPDEVRPLTGYNVPTLVDAIAKRYQFSRAPTLEEVNKTGAVFKNGMQDKKIIITDLGVFNDSIRVTTTDTSDSEKILNGLVSWLQKEFSFRQPQTKPLRAFQSDVVIEFEGAVDSALQPFAKVRELVETEMEAITGLKKPVQFNRLDFASDPLLPGQNSVLLIERRVGIPYSANRYFSKSYLTSAAHLKALEALEQAFKKAKR